MEAPKKYTCPAVCASQWRLPSLCGDDTHAAVTWPEWAREHGRHTQWSPMSVGCELGPSTCSNKDAGRRERARAHHAARTLFRTKDTVVTVEADEEDVSLLEEEEEEGKDDDNQEEFPAPSVQAAPEPAGLSRPASVPDRLSRLMAITLVYGNGSAFKRLEQS